MIDPIAVEGLQRRLKRIERENEGLKKSLDDALARNEKLLRRFDAICYVLDAEEDEFNKTWQPIETTP